jgi:D-glycero-D-manno-heptose 1,7-bisphosphate phosphatase
MIMCNPKSKILRKHRAVFLDRDGVLNRAIINNGVPFPPSTLGDFEILPGVIKACNRLKAAGFLLIVVTNQPDVARGKQPREVVEAINNTLRTQIPLNDIRVCYHDDLDGCNCRKPQPGMLLEAAQDWQIDLANSFMVGDRWKDIEAGRRAGCKTILINYGYAGTLNIKPDHNVGSLKEAAALILKSRRRRR